MSQDAGVAGVNLGSNPIKNWHRMSHSAYGFVGFPHVYTQSNTTRLFGLWDKNNWGDPWCWSHSRFNDVLFEKGLHTNLQILSLTVRDSSV